MASDDVIIGTHMAQMIKVIKAKGKAKGKAGKKCPKRERETRNSSSNSKKADQGKKGARRRQHKCALKANNNSRDEHKINLQTFDGFIGTHTHTDTNTHSHTYTAPHGCKCLPNK